MNIFKMLGSWLIGFFISFLFLWAVDTWYLPGVIFLTPYICVVYLAFVLWTSFEELFNKFVFKVKEEENDDKK